MATPPGSRVGAATSSGATAVGRREATDEKLFRATLEILRHQGADAVTIQAVAARSGVAKTTIYRRYADRHALLQATLERVLPPAALLDSNHPRSSLVRATRMMSSAVETYLGTALAAILATHRSACAEILQEKVVQPRIEVMTAFLDACVQAGHLRPDLDDTMVIDMIVGAVVAHYARFGGFDDQWPETFVAYLWPAIAAAGRGSPHPEARIR